MFGRRWLTWILLAALLTSATVLAAGGKYWEGRPDFTVGEATGYFIWQDTEGWHIRWTTKGKKHLFSGTITCDENFVHFKAISRDKTDYIKQVSSQVIRFDAKATGGADGIDFRLSPSTTVVEFDLRTDGSPAPLESIRIGRGKHRPESMPLRILRKIK
jgi:hypothetical protein